MYFYFNSAVYSLFLYSFKTIMKDQQQIKFQYIVFKSKPSKTFKKMLPKVTKIWQGKSYHLEIIMNTLCIKFTY